MKNSDKSRVVPLAGGWTRQDLLDSGETFKTKIAHTDWGRVHRWGLPFVTEGVHMIGKGGRPLVDIALDELTAPWLCFRHTASNFPEPADTLEAQRAEGLGGRGRLGEVAATYTLHYSDGELVRVPIRYRYEINIANPPWGENPVACVRERVPTARGPGQFEEWGGEQTRVQLHSEQGFKEWSQTAIHWLFAWSNPRPEVPLVRLVLESGLGTVALSSLSTFHGSAHPFRWSTRKKALLRTTQLSSEGTSADFMHLSETRMNALRCDMGEVISILPRLDFDNEQWHEAESNEVVEKKDGEFLVEYTAHPDATFSLPDGRVLTVRELESGEEIDPVLVSVPEARTRVTIRVLDAERRVPTAVRLHVHGASGEYLAPMDRHRVPNSRWFQDYAPEHTGENLFTSTYIDGQTETLLPRGDVFIEVTKGLEYRTVRRKCTIEPETTAIEIEIERVLDWRDRGWVSSDTHVHFLSPKTANLEGAAEGVHVVNLLASQWGEMLSNVGDFDGKTTFSVAEGNDEYLVRVGTENRQYVLGHISLLGYYGSIINPICAGGPDESALGDPVDVLLTEWAESCRKQGGLVVVPHSPNPRMEHAAAVVSGFVDAMEIPSNEVSISAFQLVNWYRYLNCGIQVPLTGGTDKMDAAMEIGRIRTYSRLAPGEIFTYESWMHGVREGNTFVTFGPLIEWSVNGHEAGSGLKLPPGGGTATVSFRVASLKYPMTEVQLVMNGEIAREQLIATDEFSGSFDVNVTQSGWFCLLVRGRRPDGEVHILAHTSSVMVEVGENPFFSVPDASSILAQIEASKTYVEQLGTAADPHRVREMALKLDRAYKLLHEKMHRHGIEHGHA